MLDETIATVKDVLRAYERAASSNAVHAPMAERLKKAVADLNEQKRLAAPIPRDLGDLSDLPEELLRELSVKKTDELEDQILTIMRACEGSEVNLDQILVGLYRKFKVSQTRRFLQNKLYRMYKKDLVYPVPGRRAYSLEPQLGIYSSEDDEGFGGKASPAPEPASRAPADRDDEIPF
jgi:hypothetical protein